MKLLDIMKKYDRCLVRESAKLTKIYNMLLKEAANSGVDLDEMDLDEEKCQYCGEDPCVCNEKDKECNECDDTNNIIPEKEFIKDGEVTEDDMLKNRFHNLHQDSSKGKPSSIIPESDFFAETETENQSDKNKNQPNDDGLVSAAEFFAEAEKEQKKDDIIPESEFFNETEDDNFQSAEEFFNGKNAEVPPKSKDKPKKKAEKAEKPLDEQELNFIPAEEWIQQAQEANLEESLKSYRRANHHLFNN